MEDMNVQTAKDLLDAYLYIPKAEAGIGTDPIVIDDRKLTFADMGMQTEVIVDERDAAPEPTPMTLPPQKEERAAIVIEGEEFEIASLLSEPQPEEVYP